MEEKELDAIYSKVEEMLNNHNQRMNKWGDDYMQSVQRTFLDLLPPFFEKIMPTQSIIVPIFISILNGVAVGVAVFIAIKLS